MIHDQVTNSVNREGDFSQANAKTLRPKDSILAFKLPGTWPQDPPPAQTDAIQEVQQTRTTNESDRWTKQTYPVQAPTSLGFSQRPLTPPLSEGDDKSPRNSQVNGYSPPLSESDDVVPYSQLLANNQNGSASEANLWSRKSYPLQSTKRSLTVNYSRPLSADRDHQPSLGQVPESNQDGNLENKMQQSSQAYPIQEANTTSQTVHPVLSENVKISPSVSLPQAKQEAPAQSEAQWNRRTYPLQSKSKGSTVQYSAVPPVTDEDTEKGDEVSPQQLQQTQQVTGQSKPWRRQVYPLRSPPSHLALQTAEHEDRVIDNQTASEQPYENKPRGQWHRQVYPLRQPPTVANLRTEYQTSATQVQEHPPTANDRKPRRRQAYPLASPPSIAALRTDNVTEPAQIQENIQAPNNGKPRRRQVYPLASPPSIAALRTENNGATSRQNPETDKTLNDQNSWHKQEYSLSAHKNAPATPIAPTVTPQTQQKEPEKKQPRGPIYLPKNIRAAKDSENYNAKGRTIVVCLDGTGDKFDADNSNIVHLVSSLKKDDPSQVTYYQAGIGTYSSGGLSSGFEAALDMAVGSGLGLHVRDAYHFLMHTYKEGDKICIFGFSRGAYTARCLAGMIHKVGLLPPRNIQQIPFAYEFYGDSSEAGWQQSEEFKKTFCINVNVYFLGLFDSVASVGFIPRTLPLSSTPTSKAVYFRHAMALDERRAKFKVCRHQTFDAGKDGKVTAASVGSEKHSAHGTDSPREYTYHEKDQVHDHLNSENQEYRIKGEYDEAFDTDVLEVWFLGAHADVGGGAVKNVERHKLAQIPLRWMVRQCFECDTGVIFKTKVLAEHGIDVHTLWPKYAPQRPPMHGLPPSLLDKFEKCLPPRKVRSSKLVPTRKYNNGEPMYHFQGFNEDNGQHDEDWTPEHLEDYFDAMCDLNDQLIQAPTWWILEAWPVEIKFPVPNSTDVYKRVGMNLGRYRAVEDVEPNLHWTVLHRMKQMGYKIQARARKHTSWRTVA